MTDQEVICAWMEPKPRLTKSGQFHANEKRWANDLHWWDYRPTTSPYLFPCPLTLDALWEVEERLTDGQWRKYYDALCISCEPKLKFGMYDVIHATPEQKIKALAAVLRPAKKRQA
jgi:hypothetical protein